MELAAVVQYAAFAVLSFIAVAGALGMATTMSMFRSGIFLMASFMGVAGLFILLMADLLGLLQIMMYIGGMLVMILFMLLFSNDPGGAMMSTHMNLKGFEWFFSLGLSRREQMAEMHPSATNHQDGGGTGHGRRDGQQDRERREDPSASDQQGGHQGHGEHGGHRGQGGHGDHEGDAGHGGHADMSMFTEVKKPAAVLAAAVGTLFCALLLWRPSWAVVDQIPNQNSPERIGQLLMGKYMIAFEGAGMLILLGIFGAVFAARPGRYPGSRKRSEIQAAVDETPPSIPDDRPVSLFEITPNQGED